MSFTIDSPKQFNDKLDEIGIYTISNWDRYDLEIQIVISILKNIRQDKHKLIIGRLNALDNNKFIKFLNKQKLSWSLKMNYKPNMSIIKKYILHSLFGWIMPDYKKPWVFFQINDVKDIEILLPYWNHYGGEYIFMLTENDFNEVEWTNARNDYYGTLWQYLGKVALNNYCTLVVGDDYIQLLLARKELGVIYNKVKTIIEEYNNKIKS
ncbi:MAG: hypothetical protein WC955_13195 [Elusimicrobiota bacterium]